MAPPRKRDWRNVKRFRSVEFKVWMSPAEHQQLVSDAACEGITAGALIRKKTLGSKVPPNGYRIPENSIKPELASLLGHVGKLGSNINQIARAYNSQQPVPAALHATLQQLQLLATDARTLLRSASASSDR